MFEKYSQRARMAIFFARYEASELGSPAIDTEHLLLGILRVDQSDTAAVTATYGALPRVQIDEDAKPFFRPETAATLRKQVEGTLIRGERVPPSVEIPLTKASKEVLSRAFDVYLQNLDVDVEPLHLLSAIAEEEGSVAAAALGAAGITPELIGKALARPED